MAVKFEDYYETLGVARSASQEEIQRAYRKLARKYHPDVNKEPDAAKRFAKIGEAYEVLKDPEKRRQYDELGRNWKQGQDFRPPPGWEDIQFDFRGPGGTRAAGGGGGGGGGFRPGGFSDFFEMFFGSRGGAGTRPGGGAAGARPGGASSFEDLFDQYGHARADGGSAAQAAPEHEAELTITLDEAFRGGTRRVDLEGSDGRKSLDVKIPAGSTEGTRLRLRQHGVVLKIKLAKHPRYEVAGHDLTTDLYITPAEAALGDKVEVKTMDGSVSLTIPPGAQSGQKLRLRGRGLPHGKDDKRGDMLVRLLIRVPTSLTDEEREAYEKLRDVSTFNPRGREE
ncbi:MAG: DnaJ C-terminal domain-containing protein [Phycisphaeraceae bacterium]